MTANNSLEDAGATLTPSSGATQPASKGLDGIEAPGASGASNIGVSGGSIPSNGNTNTDGNPVTTSRKDVSSSSSIPSRKSNHRSNRNGDRQKSHTRSSKQERSNHNNNNTNPANSSNNNNTQKPPHPGRIISQLRSTAIAHPQQQCTLTCYIPPSRVGAVIGRKGNTILHIQREAVKKSWGHGGQVRVSVVSQAGSSGASEKGEEKPSKEEDDGETIPNDNDIGGGIEETSAVDPASSDAINSGEGANGLASTDEAEEMDSIEGGMAVDDDNEEEEEVEEEDDSHLWTPVIIRGDPCGAIAAAKLLIPLLLPGPLNEMDDPDYDISSDMDDVVLDIPIHRPRHAAIIGKKGSTIATLSADHNVRIMVPHRNQQIKHKGNGPTNINVVQLEGQLDDVERCLVQILKIVCGSPSSSTSSSQGNNANTQSNSDANKETHANSAADSVKTISQEPITNNDDSPTVDNGTISDDKSSVTTSTESTKGLTITVKPTNNNSKKEPKYLEQTINVSPELSHLVPSLGKLKQIGKSTNAVIRRKRIDCSSDNNGEGNKSEVGESDKVASSAADDAAVVVPSIFSTQLIISGKTECVKNATVKLSQILTPSSSSATSISMEEKDVSQALRSRNDVDATSKTQNSTDVKGKQDSEVVNEEVDTNTGDADAAADEISQDNEEDPEKKQGGPRSNNVRGRGRGGRGRGRGRGNRGGRGRGRGRSSNSNNTNSNSGEGGGSASTTTNVSTTKE